MSGPPLIRDPLVVMRYVGRIERLQAEKREIVADLHEVEKALREVWKSAFAAGLKREPLNDLLVERRFALEARAHAEAETLPQRAIELAERYAELAR